jgi:hypothetical protein
LTNVSVGRTWYRAKGVPPWNFHKYMQIYNCVKIKHLIILKKPLTDRMGFDIAIFQTLLNEIPFGWSVGRAFH